MLCPGTCCSARASAALEHGYAARALADLHRWSASALPGQHKARPGSSNGVVTLFVCSMHLDT